MIPFLVFVMCTDEELGILVVGLVRNLMLFINTISQADAGAIYQFLTEFQKVSCSFFI